MCFSVNQYDFKVFNIVSQVCRVSRIIILISSLNLQAFPLSNSIDNRLRDLAHNLEFYFYMCFSLFWPKLAASSVSLLNCLG